MKRFKKIAITFLVAVVTAFSTILPNTALTTSAYTFDYANTTQYLGSQTTSGYANGVPINVTVYYYYTNGNYSKQVQSISSVFVSVGDYNYAGSLSNYSYISGNTIYVNVYGTLYSNGFSDSTYVNKTFTFYVF